MKTLFLFLIALLPILAQAIPDNSVYSNSGSTDAPKDGNTDISVMPTAPMPVPQNQEEQREEIKKDEFKEGPYDKKGNYRYTPEIRSEENAP